MKKEHKFRIGQKVILENIEEPAYIVGKINFKSYILSYTIGFKKSPGRINSWNLFNSHDIVSKPIIKRFKLITFLYVNEDAIKLFNKRRLNNGTR